MRCVVGSIPIWKKSARLRSELPSRPPVEICPMWLTWSVAWLSVNPGFVPKNFASPVLLQVLERRTRSRYVENINALRTLRSIAA